MSVDDPGCFRTALKEMMHDMYPGVEDEREDDLPFEHPLTAVGIVLLSATMLRSVDVALLARFTGYSAAFISVIADNMTNNKLWVDGSYDTADWLRPDSGIGKEEFWIHVEIAYGGILLSIVDERLCRDPCEVYRGERGRFVRGI